MDAGWFIKYSLSDCTMQQTAVRDNGSNTLAPASQMTEITEAPF